MRDIAPATTAGGAEPALATLDQVSLNGLAGQLRDRQSASFGLVAKPGIELVGELDRRPFHSMPAYRN